MIIFGVRRVIRTLFTLLENPLKSLVFGLFPNTVGETLVTLHRNGSDYYVLYL